MILLNLRDLPIKKWFIANNQFFPFLIAACISLFGIGCVSKGYSYQGNPLFGWMESSGEVRTTDPYPILKRYPSFQATDFEFPVGGKYAEGYYLAQKFGAENGKFGGRKHLGED
ncbi:hypothetical protein [Leptospira harrisiae]|nr:hypothetical protein [Leptospira harrisiae]